jgi:transposase InsO family protein
VDVYKNASSKNAALFLEKVIKEMPFFIDGIQIDGGSEFMGEFEDACRRQQLKLFVLPPRSPKLNGSVERSNGTWRYEFYWCYDLPLEIDELREEVTYWQYVHNHIRPHRALKGKTPYENMMKDEA